MSKSVIASKGHVPTHAEQCMQVSRSTWRILPCPRIPRLTP